jgi:hypothetical protein
MLLRGILPDAAQQRFPAGTSDRTTVTSSRQPGNAVRNRVGQLLWHVRPTVAAAAAVGLVCALASGCGTGSGPARAAPPARSPATSVTSVRDYLGVGASSDQLPPSVVPGAYKGCLDGPFSLIDKASADIAGYSDASKQNGALPVGFPTLAAAVTPPNSQDGLGSAPIVIVHHQQYTCTVVKLQLDYNGLAELPPVTATFLAFGFMPVSATIHLTQITPGPIVAVAYQDVGPPPLINRASVPPYTAVSAVTMSAELTDVKVNGVPLDVGSDCHAGPVYTPELDNELGLPGTLVLAGGNAIGDPLPQYGQPQFGGALAALVTIPPFTGCEAPDGEDLDPLLSASVSGAGNYLKVIQGPLCALPPGFKSSPNCTKQLLPVDQPLWTVTHGGSYTGTGQFEISQISEPLTGGTTITTNVTCPGSISGVIPDLIGPPRDADLGTVTLAGTTCTGTSTGRKASTWTLRQQGLAFLDGKGYPYPTPGIVSGNLDDLTFVLTQIKGSEPGCTATVAGNPGASYANASSTLGVSVQVPITSTTCKELPVSGGPDGNNNHDGAAFITGSYALNPAGITIVSP